MNKTLMVVLTPALVLLVVLTSGCSKTKFSIQDRTLSIKMECMDHSAKSDNGNVLADIYFDKPIISGKSEAVSKINKYFDDEYKSWFNGESDRLNFYHSNSMNEFLENLNKMRNGFGDDTIAKQPLQYTVDTETVFSNKGVLSTKQCVYWFSGGPSNFNCFGSTFDLKTGELLPFTYFYDVNADDFRDCLVKFLINNKFDNFLSDLEIKQLLGSNTEHNFEYEGDGHKWNLAYEYYYDGNSIYLTLNQVSMHSGYLIKWNGKTGNKFEATMMSCKKNDI